jgi:hypothetical protein
LENLIAKKAALDAATEAAESEGGTNEAYNNAKIEAEKQY